VTLLTERPAGRTEEGRPAYPSEVLEREPQSAAQRIRLAWEAFHRRPRPREKASFYFRLATLLEAGIPVFQALRQAGGSKRIFDVTTILTAAASRGEPISSAMPNEPALFDPVEIALIRTGEEAGKLGECCSALATRFEAEQQDLDEFHAGVRYPVFLLHFAILVLPLPVIFQKGLGAYAASAIGCLAVLYGVVSALLLLHSAYRSEPRYASVLDSLPLLGRLRRLRAEARFARTFAAVHSAGLPFERCLTLASEASGLPERAGDVGLAAHALRQGAPLGQAVTLLPWLSADLVAAFSVGEKAGRLEESVGKVAQDLDRRARLAADRVRKTLPIVVYLLIAFWIAWHIVTGFSDTLSQIQQIR
jgi:type II secretory pathway component PulF